ncbi:MAG: DUF4974 domain-containing protein [Cyclobacteriaceae bacterium]|nr:DUF4974 domain-containing protein [Cyclobacteriaceae bacterium]
MNYKSYTTEDFVLDQKFRNWILNPDTELNLYWAKIIKDHPDKISEIREAINVTLNIHDFKYKISPDRSMEIWNYINNNMDHKEADVQEGNKVIPLNSQSVIGWNMHQKRKRTRYFLRYAATLAFAILSGVVLFFTFNQNDVSEPVAQNDEWVIKKNPWGQKSTIFLSDGSEVVLNVGSTLRYLEDFSDNERILYLDGEAFFTVSKDSLRPFRVFSGELMTEALGTAFNVKAYPEERNISIALESGRVQITPLKGKNTPVTLEPGLKMDYDEENEKLRVTSFDSREIISWKSGIIYFKNANEQQVFSKLEKWYGVNFQVNDLPGDKKWSYTAEFTNKSLENVLRSIGFSMNFNFYINNKNVQITYN